MPNLEPLLESILFVASKPLETKQLASATGRDEPDVRQALQTLAEQRREQGIVLLEANDRWQLATNPAHAETVTNFLNAELREQLTDATVEVLGIIAYRQPISPNEIEAIRGVNSQYSIRQLLIRGLVERIPNPNDSRSSLYQVTTDFLQQLGLQSIKDLPDFDQLTGKIKLPETSSVPTADSSADNLIDSGPEI